MRSFLVLNGSILVALRLIDLSRKAGDRDATKCCSYLLLFIYFLSPMMQGIGDWDWNAGQARIPSFWCRTGFLG